MKKTKIVATIGPVSESKEILKELILNGMNVARINMAHANEEFLTNVVKKINILNKELSTNVAVMVDLEGPQVSIGKLMGNIAYLQTGDI